MLQDSQLTPMKLRGHQDDAVWTFDPSKLMSSLEDDHSSPAAVLAVNTTGPSVDWDVFLGDHTKPKQQQQQQAAVVPLHQHQQPVQLQPSSRPLPGSASHVGGFSGVMPLRDISQQALQQGNLSPKSQLSPVSTTENMGVPVPASSSSSDSEPGPSVRRQRPVNVQVVSSSPPPQCPPNANAAAGIDIAKTVQEQLSFARAPPSYAQAQASTSPQSSRQGLSSSPSLQNQQQPLWMSAPPSSGGNSPTSVLAQHPPTEVMSTTQQQQQQQAPPAFDEDDCSSVHSTASSDWDSPRQGGEMLKQQYEIKKLVGSASAPPPPPPPPPLQVKRVNGEIRTGQLGEGQVLHPPTYQQLLRQQQQQAQATSPTTMGPVAGSPTSSTQTEPTLEQIVSEQFQYSQSQINNKKLEEISSVDQLQERVGKVMEQRRLKEQQLQQLAADAKAQSELQATQGRWQGHELTALIEFKNLRRLRVAVPPETTATVGGFAIVEIDSNVGWAAGTPNPVDCGQVVGVFTPEQRASGQVPRSGGFSDQGVVLRMATEEDCKIINDILPKFEDVAIKHCLQLIHFLHLPFKVVDTEYSFDRRVCRILYTLDSGNGTTTDVYVHRLQRELSTRLKCRVQLDRDRTLVADDSQQQQ